MLIESLCVVADFKFHDYSLRAISKITDRYPAVKILIIICFIRSTDLSAARFEISRRGYEE